MAGRSQRLLFEPFQERASGSAKSPRKKSTTDSARYAPLPSVWEGKDSELLERMLRFYPRKKPRRILDASVNGGRFWRGSTRPVIGIDIDGRHGPSIVADNMRMPFARVLGNSCSVAPSKHLAASQLCHKCPVVMPSEFRPMTLTDSLPGHGAELAWSPSPRHRRPRAVFLRRRRLYDLPASR